MGAEWVADTSRALPAARRRSWWRTWRTIRRRSPATSVATAPEARSAATAALPERARHPLDFASESLPLGTVEHGRESQPHGIEHHAKPLVRPAHGSLILLRRGVEQRTNGIALRVAMRRDDGLHVRHEATRPPDRADLIPPPPDETRVGEEAECEPDDEGRHQEDERFDVRVH